MKQYDVTIDTVIEGNFRKEGDTVQLTESVAEAYLKAGVIADPDAAEKAAKKRS